MAVCLLISRSPKPTDRSIKRRTEGAMTVCIAAARQEKGEARIVLWSDTRLDYRYVKIGGVIRVPESAIKELVEAGTVPALKHPGRD